MELPSFDKFASFLENHPELFETELQTINLYQLQNWPLSKDEFHMILQENNQRIIQASSRHMALLLHAYHLWLQEALADQE